MGLERGQPVDDVHARFLQRARPADVGALVETRLELDEADHLLAALRGADQRRDERRIVARAVHGLLDGEYVGVGDRLFDQPLDRRRERVVGVVQEDVALAHRRHHVDRLGLLGHQPRLRDRRPRRVAQLREPRDLHDLPQVVEVEQPVDREHVLVLGLERALELLAHLAAHPRLDLDAHDLAEAPAPELVLDRLQEVVGLVGDGEVGVAGDAEDRGVDDLHAREELVEVLGDQLLERHERAPVGQRHEARQHLGRHLHAREDLRVADRVVDDDTERQRQVRDVGERPRRARRRAASGRGRSGAGSARRGARARRRRRRRG